MKSLPATRVRSLLQDSNGNIWIGTDEGISIFDYSRQQFSTVYANSRIEEGKIGPIVRAIFQEKKDNRVLCFTEKEGVLIFNMEGELLHQHIPTKNLDLINASFYNSAEVSEGVFLLTSDKGLVLFDLHKGVFERVLKDQFAYCEGLAVGTENRILVGLGTGVALIEFNPSNRSFILKKEYFKSTQIKTLEIDYQQRLWVGTVVDGIIKINSLDELVNEAKSCSFLL